MAKSYTFEEMTGSSPGSDMPVQAMPKKTSYTFEELQGAQTPSKKKQKSFSTSVSEDAGNRATQAMMSGLDYVAGKKSFPEFALSMPATAARFIGDVVGEGLSRATPDFIKNVAGKAGVAIMETPVGQEAGKIAGNVAQDYGAFEKSYPRSSQALEDLAVLGVSGLGTVGTGMAAKKVGTGLEKAGEVALESVPKLERIKNADNPYIKLITPTIDKKNIKQYDVVEVGLNKEQKVLPNKSELEVVEELKKLKGVSPRAKSKRGNYNIIRFEKNKTAKNLSAVLKDKKAPIAPLNNEFDKLEMRVKNMEGVTDERRKSLLEPIRMMKQNIERKSGDINLEELWSARQRLDTDIELASGADLTPKIRKVYDDGVKELRDITNQYIDSYSPGTLESLKKQSALARAEKALEPKVLKEPKTRGERIVKNLDKTFPGKDTLGKAILAAPTVGLLAAKGVANLGAKLTRNPTLRKALGIALSKTGQLMKGGKELTEKQVEKLAESPVAKKFAEPKQPLKTKIIK